MGAQGKGQETEWNNSSVCRKHGTLRTPFPAYLMSLDDALEGPVSRSREHLPGGLCSVLSPSLSLAGSHV